MDPRVTTKDVSIKGKNYRLRKMDSRLATWLFVSLAGKADDGGNIISSLSKFTQAEFNTIQSHALGYVTVVELNEGQELLTPIMTNGGIILKSLSEDPVTVLKLTTDSIMFNISCFLEESESTEPQ